MTIQEQARSLGENAYRKVTWREGTRGPQSSRFAACRVRTAHRHTPGALAPANFFVASGLPASLYLVKTGARALRAPCAYQEHALVEAHQDIRPKFPRPPSSRMPCPGPSARSCEVEVVTGKKTRALSLAGGVAAISLICLVGLTLSASSDRPGSDESDDQRSPAAVKPGHEQVPRSSDVRRSSTPDSAAELRAPRSNPPPRRASRDQDHLRRALEHKFARQSSEQERDDEGSPAGAQPVLPPASWSSLPEEYITGILQEQLIPVAQACYEDIAPEGSNGELTLRIAVIGDSELGGVVTQIDVNTADTTIKGELTECVRQTAYTLELDPPEEGQSVQEFDFTVEFSEEDPD